MFGDMIILLKNSYFNEMQITLDNGRVERLGIYRLTKYAIEQIKIFTIIKCFNYLNR